MSGRLGGGERYIFAGDRMRNQEATGKGEGDAGLYSFE